MTHVFEGIWDSTTINEEGDPKIDGRFNLTIDARSGNIIPPSVHIAANMTETAVTGTTTVGRFKRITIFLGSRRRYEGVITPGSSDKFVGGLLSVSGDDFERGEDDGEEETKGDESGKSRSRRLTNQEQAIWVATKP